MSTSGGYKRLGEFVARERGRRGYRSRAAFARAIGIGKRTIDKIETGVPVDYRPHTRAAIEGGLLLAPGSIDRILEGKRPLRLTDESLATLLELWPQLSSDSRAMLVSFAQEAAKRAT
jgi:DNA-binding XRE family transcriptional regulator